MSDSKITYSPIPVNNQIALFDYDALDTETRIVVRQRTEEIKTLMRRTAQDIIDIGRKLTEVKTHLEHGKFLRWIDAEFQWDRTTANRFMNVASRFGDYEMLQIATFAPSALTLLASPSVPDTAIIEALDRANGGEQITHAKAQEIVAEHKEPTPSVRYVPTGEPDPDEEETITEIHIKAYCPVCHESHRDWFQILYADEVIYECGDCRSHYGEYYHGLTSEDWEHARWGGSDFDETGKPRDPSSDFDLSDINSPEPTKQEIPPVPTNRAYKNSSESNEWYTPRPIIEKAFDVMDGIDLDPASTPEANKTVLAKQIYTIEDDALQQRWQGRVWLNPPYGNDVAPFVDKLVASYLSGDVPEALLLVAARTDTAWFRTLREFPRCFIWGRLKFINGETGEPGDPAGFPSMVVYLGSNLQKFVNEFQTLGDVYLWIGGVK